MKHQLIDLRDDMLDLASKEEVEILRFDMSKIKNSSAEFIDKEECI
jgi:hypothetical protein